MVTEVQEDLKKLRDIRYWVRKATPGTEESKEPPKKQPIKEILQDKTDEKKAQRTAPAQANLYYFLPVASMLLPAACTTEEDFGGGTVPPCMDSIMLRSLSGCDGLLHSFKYIQIYPSLKKEKNT